MKKKTFKVRLQSEDKSVDICGKFNSRAELFNFAKFAHANYEGLDICVTFNDETICEGAFDDVAMDAIEGVVCEESIAFSDKDFFRDEEEHFYTCECHDGFAECVSEENNDKVNPHLKIKVEYPLLEDVLKDDGKVAAIRDYRGLSEDEEITFGDVMICYGEIMKRWIYWVDDLMDWLDIDVLCIEKFGIEHYDEKVTHISLDENDRLHYWDGEPNKEGSKEVVCHEYDILNCF